MCGRYVSVAGVDDLLAGFQIDERCDDDVPPSWNVAPTDPVRIVYERFEGGPGPADSDSTDDAAGHAVRKLRTARWGLVPRWSRDAQGSARMINARIETVAEKPAFKAPAARQRCLVPATGYYEWQTSGGRKVPYFLHGADDELLAFAGLYEWWRDKALPDGDPKAWLLSCTIITRQAPDVLGHIHERSPVLIPPDLRADWLDCRAPSTAIIDELRHGDPAVALVPTEVGPAVGNVRNNHPGLITPVG